MNDNTYYQKVNQYYNQDASHFEERYGANNLLQHIRSSFRNETLPYTGKAILEVGYGPGFDLVFFGNYDKEAKVYGIDISDEMRNLAENNIRKAGLSNVTAAVGSVEDLQTLFPGVQFDTIYVYFGALNTVKDLDKTAEIFKTILKPGGHLALTFINKYYLALVAKNLVHGRFRLAFSRLRKIWGGYSPYRYLESRCYSFSDIKKSFAAFSLLRRRGYSISYPAWYEHKKFKGKERLLARLWRTDKILNKTFLWQCGEYSLYIFKKPD